MGLFFYARKGSITSDWELSTTEIIEPKKLDIKSNDRGAFCMKLTYEDKLEIYKLRKNGMSWYLKYMIKLIDMVLRLLRKVRIGIILLN